LTEGLTVFELKEGNVTRLVGIFVLPPPHPAPHLVAFQADWSIRLRMSKDLTLVVKRGHGFGVEEYLAGKRAKQESTSPAPQTNTGLVPPSLL
jgi:hypothetical protein